MTIDGAPISGARVEGSLPETSDARAARYLAADSRRAAIASATTDASGNFSLDVKKIAAVDVSVEKAGYEPVTISLGGDEDAGAIPLRPAPIVSGLVTGGGKPLSNARLVFRSVAGEFIAMTDAEGRYSVPDPRIWRANVTIDHREFAPYTQALTERKSLNFQLAPGTAVTGRVVGADRKTPVAGATVKIGSRRVTTAEDGSFSAGHVEQKRPVIVAESGNLVGTDSGDQRSVTVVLRRATTLSGGIRDARTQRPLAGAVVTLGGGSNPFTAGDGTSVVSDANGAFSFKRAVPGRSRLSASFPNYNFSFLEVDARAGETVSRDLSGTPNATVIGTVLDEARKVVTAARVAATPMSDNPSQRMRRLIQQQPVAFSGPDGRYVVRNVIPEEQIEISAARKGIPSGTAGPFKLASGEVKRGVTVVLPRGLTLRGRVTDREGRPLGGVVVIPFAAEDSVGMVRRMILRGQPGSERDTNVETNAEGNFALQLKEGRYDFTFERTGYAPKRMRGIAVAGNADPLQVTLEAGVEISGRVVRRDGSGISDVDIVIMTDVGRNEPISTGPDGSFAVPDIAPGSVMLMALKPEEFVRETRNVVAPATNLVIEIAPGGRIEGRVVEKGSKRPVSQFRVSASNSISGGGMRFVYAPMFKSFDSEDGSFVLENVPAGKTDLSVEAAGFVSGRSLGVTVEEGKPLKDVEIELAAGVRLYGKVTGPDGSPLSGAMVRPEEPQQPARQFFSVRTASSDGAGDYVLEGMESGEKTIVFERDGYLPERKPVNLTGKEVRLDARLGKGKEVAGTVVDEQGMPVSNAAVTASSGVQDAGYRSSRTDSNGAFRFEGLPPGRFTFRASKTGYVTGEARDIDLDAATAGLRITLSSGGVIFGRVQNVSEDEIANATVMASGPSNRFSSAPIRQDGTYRIEGAPTGSVRVNARTGRFPSFKTTPAKVVEVAPGAEVQLDLEFGSDLVIRGRVTRQGRPLDSAMVSFTPGDTRLQTRAATRTLSDGSYEISGLEPGSYSVDVTDMQRSGSGSYSTTYEVTGSGTFDIEMRGSQVRGRVLDADTGEPIAEASVTLQKADGQPAYFGPQGSAITDGAGNFVFDTVSPGSYRARAQKERYGQAIADVIVVENQDREVELKVTRIDGVRLRVVDARDNRALSAFVWIRDQHGRDAYEGYPRPNSEGLLMVPLAPGGYQAIVSANGYAARAVNVVAPSQELRIALTPGGSIVIQSKQAERETAKLMTPTGSAYQRGPWAKPEFLLPPGTTIFDHLAPGAYVLQLLDNRGNVKSSFSVTVVEGQVAVLEI